MSLASRIGLKLAPFTISALVASTAAAQSLSYPTSVDFGSVTVGVAIHAPLGPFSNTGSSVILFSGAQITGPNAQEFSLQQGAFPQLSPGSTFLTTVFFTPTGFGSRVAQLVLTTNAPQQPTITIALSGVGAGSCPAVTAIASGGATITPGLVAMLTGSGGVSCTWSPADGLTNPNSCTTLASPALTTMYTLSVVDSRNCPSTNAPAAIVTVVDDFTGLPGPPGPSGPAGPPGPQGSAAALEAGAAVLRPLAGPNSVPPPTPTGYALVGIFKLEKPTGENTWFAVYVRIAQ